MKYRLKATQRQKIMQKSLSKINSQLDLIKFFRNMRMQSAALAGLLNTNQSIYVRKFSHLVVHESSSESHHSSDSSEVSIDPATLNKTFERKLKSMVNSKNEIDKRFIQLYLIRLAKKSGISIGMNGYNLDCL